MINTIPIALVTDNNYVMPTLVTLESLIKNKNPESIYSIYVIADNITNESKLLLKDLECEKVTINIIDYENSYRNVYNENIYVSNATFIRFDIPKILVNYDKILYLDTDIIVQKDLTELYETDLQDTYAGVVLDIGELFYDLTERTKVDRYFNAGMILYNAKKYRNENLTKKLIEIYNNNFKELILMDQDALNIVFNNNITVLSPLYNYQQSISEYWEKEVLEYYSLSTKIKINDIHIIHYTRMKPWIYKCVYLRNIWLFYYKKTIYCKDKLKLQSGLLLRIYFNLRAKFKLKKINTTLKNLQRRTS